MVRARRVTAHASQRRAHTMRCPVVRSGTEVPERSDAGAARRSRVAPFAFMPRRRRRWRGRRRAWRRPAARSGWRHGRARSRMASARVGSWSRRSRSATGTCEVTITERRPKRSSRISRRSRPRAASIGASRQSPTNVVPDITGRDGRRPAGPRGSLAVLPAGQPPLRPRRHDADRQQAHPRLAGAVRRRRDPRHRHPRPPPAPIACAHTNGT